MLTASHRRRNPMAFTLVELLVVIGIIAVLISLLLPVLTRAREHSSRIACAANLRSIGQGMYLYANAHRDRLPNSNLTTTWSPAIGGEALIGFAREYSSA